MIRVVVFFFKQKTAYEMRISDGSSDVCSSDLPGANAGVRPEHPQAHDDQRVVEWFLQWLPLRRASDGDADRRRRFAVGVLQRPLEPQGSASPGILRAPHYRQDSDDSSERKSVV